MFRTRLIFFVLISCCIAACDNQSNAPTIIKMADKTFVMPAEVDYPWWSFMEDKQWLRFNLNAKTFIHQSTDTPEQKRTVVEVKIGPLWSMDRGWYWTEKDKILKQKPISCEEINYAGKKYKLCNHGADSEKKVSPSRYTIVDDRNDIISFLECTKVETQLPNPQCDIRSRFMDNLQINYNYNIGNFADAVKIDHKLRDFISNFHQANP